MTALLQTQLKIDFHVWKLLYFDSNFIDFFLSDLINNKPALDQVMGWHLVGETPYVSFGLDELMLLDNARCYE